MKDAVSDDEDEDAIVRTSKGTVISSKQQELPIIPVQPPQSPAPVQPVHHHQQQELPMPPTSLPPTGPPALSSTPAATQAPADFNITEADIYPETLSRADADGNHRNVFIVVVVSMS
jgi:hypothetical protein